MVPAGGEPGPDEARLAEALERRIAAYREQLEAMEFRKALAELRAVWVHGNEYLQRTAPWQAIKSDRDRAAVIVRTAVQLVRLFAIIAWPVIPASAERVLTALGEEVGGDAAVPAWPGPVAAELAAIPAGRPLGEPGILFRKIPPEEVATLEAEFGGHE